MNPAKFNWLDGTKHQDKISGSCIIPEECIGECLSMWSDARCFSFTLLLHYCLTWKKGLRHAGWEIQILDLQELLSSCSCAGELHRSSINRNCATNCKCAFNTIMSGLAIKIRKHPLALHEITFFSSKEVFISTTLPSVLALQNRNLWCKIFVVNQQYAIASSDWLRTINQT